VILLFLECERDRTVFLSSFQGVTAFLRERFRRSRPISVTTVHRFWTLLMFWESFGPFEIFQDQRHSEAVMKRSCYRWWTNDRYINVWQNKRNKIPGKFVSKTVNQFWRTSSIIALSSVVLPDRRKKQLRNLFIIVSIRLVNSCWFNG